MPLGDANHYSALGASADKGEVKKAIAHIDRGLFPTAFCKILPDIAGDPSWCTVLHSDSAGTKSSLAYMYYKETGDVAVFRGIVQDAVVMNVDDIACVGVVDGILLDDTISRNKFLVAGEVVRTLINECDRIATWLTTMGISTTFGGGETADVGDLVRTLDVICAVVARLPRARVVTNENIQAGDVIVGLASAGQASYEEEFNSGISTNGLTLARHGTLHQDYCDLYPEAYDPAIRTKGAFSGQFHLTDAVEGMSVNLGQALLCPTRTYAPVIRDILAEWFPVVHGLVHCTGGGQTKCLNFGRGIHYRKDNLLPMPRIFEVIQESSNTPLREMYQVFNMGHRMEIICQPENAPNIIEIAHSYSIDAQVIGTCEESSTHRNQVTIESGGETFSYPE